MDTYSESVLPGTSIFADNIRPADPEDDDEEEENRKREKDIHDALVEGFDDLDEEESLINRTSNCSPLPDREQYQGEEYQSSQVFLDEGYSQHENGEGTDVGCNSEVREGIDYNHVDLTHSGYDSSHVNPWSDDDQENSNQLLVGSNGVAGNQPLFKYQENASYNLHTGNGESCNFPEYENENEGYLANKYMSGVVENVRSKDFLAEECQNSLTPYDELKLLYEQRGLELDKQAAEIKQLKTDSGKNIRALQHQLNLTVSDNETKAANLKQLEILLSEREKRIDSLMDDVKQLENKLSITENENEKLRMEIESAESTITSLECQVSGLMAADNVARNQKLHKEFVQKLQQGNEEEKAMLRTKFQVAQEKSESHEEEVKKLREELKSLRGAHEKVLVEKTEVATKLTLTNETIRKQYEDLMKMHDSQQVLELQTKIKLLQSNKEDLEKTVDTLQGQLAKAKEDLEGYDRAVKIGILKDIIPAEDSMTQLGIAKTLNYETSISPPGEPKVHSLENATQMQEKLKDELKRSILSNKVKRDDIAMQQEEIRMKELVIKKTQSELKSSRTEIKELKNNLAQVQMELALYHEQRKSTNAEDLSKLSALQAENVLLKEEQSLLSHSLRQLKESVEGYVRLLENLKENVSNISPGQVNGALVDRVGKLLVISKSLTENIEDKEKYQEIFSQIREENKKMHEGQALWEKKLTDIQLKLNVSEKMISNFINDQSATDELTHACKTLRLLLNDIRDNAASVKAEVMTSHQENLNLKDKISKANLDIEELEKVVSEFRKEKEYLQREFATVIKKKDDESKATLEKCKDTYLKFHEEAMEALKFRINEEYGNIVATLKNEIARLAEELSNTKGLYVDLCQEKNSLEEEYKKCMKTKIDRKDFDVASASTPDSGVGVEGDLKKNESEDKLSVSIYEKKLHELQIELSSFREIVRGKDDQLNKLQENIHIVYKKFGEKEGKDPQDILEALERMQKKCFSLEESNLLLENKCANLEKELRKAQNRNKSGTVGSEELQNCRRILDEQRKQFEKREEELKTQTEKEIQDLKDYIEKHVKIKSQESENLVSYQNQLKGKIDELTVVKEQLQRMKEKVELKDKESEDEVQKLTDMLLALESKSKEQQEENNNMKFHFEKLIKHYNDERTALEMKLQKIEDQYSDTIKETKSKYNALKTKYTEVLDYSRKLNPHYKKEFARVESEYKKNMETLKSRVQVYVEEVKRKCITKISNVAKSLRSIVGTQEAYAQILLALDRLVQELKDFSVRTY